MRPEEYLDLTIKLIVALFIPLGWAAIFYPLMKRFKKAWPLLLTIATLLSLALLIIKEAMDRVAPVFDELVAYLLGIFFGTAILSSLFNFKNKWLLVLPKSGTSFQVPKDTALAGLPKTTHKDGLSFSGHHNIHLQNLLQATILAEERGKDFYDTLAEKVISQNAKDLCLRLAKEELKHKAFIEKILYQWLPLPLDTEALILVEQEMAQWNILLNQPDINSTEEEMVKYAIEQEKIMADFYLSFEKSFPTAWKMIDVQMLVMA